MREQLKQYVELLFAGAADTEDIKQEILQNTLDRYDDLVSEGKSPEAAYRLAITGIGDINEILGGSPVTTRTSPAATADIKSAIHEEADAIQKRKMRAVAVALYILCAVPIIVFSEFGLEILGLCITLVMVAGATALVMMSRKDSPEEPSEKEAPLSPEDELRKTVSSIIGWASLIIYLAISFVTGAWYITWIIFPISGAIKGLVRGFIDLKTSKGNAIARIILNIVLILLMLGVFGVVLGFSIYSFDLGITNGNYITGESSVPADQVTELHIEWASGTITVQTGDTDKIIFTESGSDIDTEPMVYELENGELSICYSKPALQMGITATIVKDLTITVPRDWNCGNLHIEAASTDVEVFDMTMNSVELECASGECTFTNCTVKELDLDAASCAVTFSGTLETLDCDGASTEITAVLTNVPSAINLDGASAELDLTLPSDCGFRVDMDGVSCDFDSDFDYHHSNGCSTYGNESCHINVDGMSASVYIRNGGTSGHHTHTDDCYTDDSTCPDNQQHGDHHF